MGFRQLQLRGKLRPLGDAEVGLGNVLLLQPVQLLVGEGGARLPVRPVLPQGALEGQVVHVLREGWGGGGERLVGRKTVWGGSSLLQLLQQQKLGERGSKLRDWGGKRERRGDAVGSVEVSGRRRGGGMGGRGGWAWGGGGVAGRWWRRVEFWNPFTFYVNFLLLGTAVV